MQRPSLPKSGHFSWAQQGSLQASQSFSAPVHVDCTRTKVRSVCSFGGSVILEEYMPR